MSFLKGTPAYWKKCLRKILAMLKQLGIATFSCADDLLWNEMN